MSLTQTLPSLQPQTMATTPTILPLSPSLLLICTNADHKVFTIIVMKKLLLATNVNQVIFYYWWIKTVML